MLSNELRDFERDKSLGIKTLTVRIGFKNSKLLYLTLLSSSYLLTVIFVLTGYYPISTLSVVITIPLAVKAFKNVAQARKTGVPVTNQLHLSFGLLQLLALFLA
jgi:1,4-dihydroxy-2-naphthoate octaprenyltransferase